MPIAPPPLQVAIAIFDSVVMATRDFEIALIKQSHKYAAFRREQNPNIVFQDVKPTIAPGVDLLMQPTKALIEHIDIDERKIVLDCPCDFVPTSPLLCGNHALDVIHHEADAIWVSDVSPFRIGMVVSQTRFIGNHHELAQEFVDAWKARWMRHRDVPPQRWNEIIRFAKTHMPPGRFAWPPMEADDLFRVIHRKHARTSAGFDGVILTDLKAMPMPKLRAFYDMFSAAETTGSWPSQLIDDRVVSLAKTSSPSTPSDFRPITIFGLLYRCWSSFHATQALLHLDRVLPDTLFGCRPGRHAAQIWAQLLWTIEESLASQIPLTGTVADLTKAFNFLPRLVVMELAAYLGVPCNVLIAWTGALTDVRRRFQLRDGLSPGVPSVTGVPEGCGLSCVAMVIIDACFHTWMKVYFPMCTPVSYVDDWQLITCHPALLQGTIDQMNRFAQAMDLHLDDRKAYSWSLCPDGRKLLKSQGFKVVLGAKNLGAQVQLSRKHTNAAIQDRISAMHEVWPKFRFSASKNRVKVRALLMSAWPRALHAIAATALSDAGFHKLRTGAVRGLDADHSGMNAWIHLGMIEKPGVDPQCWAVLQTLRSVRDCGHEVSVLCMLAHFAFGTDVAPNNSFTHTLLTRLQTLGWHVYESGQVGDFFGRFNLFGICFDEFQFRISWAWQFVVSQQVQHRPGFRELHHADATDTRAWFSYLRYDDQELFKKCLNGSHISQDAKMHCQESGTDQCPYCQCGNSRFHRFWICEYFAAARSDVPKDVLALIPTLPEYLTCYGWSVRPYTLHTWYQYLQDIPQPPTLSWQPPAGEIHLFTDGSYMNQHEPSCRLTSWAVVCAFLDNLQPPIVMDSGPLPGLLQSAYRAEVFALWRALVLGRFHSSKVYIWIDCAAVVKKLNRCLRGSIPRPNSAHADLWNAIVECLHNFAPGQVVITKVAAHLPMAQALTPLEDWCFFHNHFVDRAAVMVQWQRPAEFWTFFSRHILAVEASRTISRHVQTVLLTISQLVVRSEQPVPAEVRDNLCCSPEVPFEAQLVLSQLHIPAAATRWYGDMVVREILSWYWQTAYNSPHPFVWISQYQLYVDFMLSGVLDRLSFRIGFLAELFLRLTY